MWELENSHGTRLQFVKQLFTANVWNDGKFSPSYYHLDWTYYHLYVLSPWLYARKHLVLLQEVLPEMTNVIVAHVWREWGFNMLDYANSIRGHLDRVFGNNRIGRGVLVSWFLGSPYLFRSVYFIWDAMHIIVFNMRVSSEMDLVAWICIAAAIIHESPSIFENDHQYISRRCHVHIHAKGHNFKHLLLCLKSKTVLFCWAINHFTLYIL